MFVNHAGFSISSRKLQVVEIDFNDGRFLIENIDEEPFPYELTANISANRLLSALQPAYENIKNRKELKTDIVSFALPSFFFKSAKIPYDPNLITKDLERHLQWEFGILFPDVNPSDYVIDKFPVAEDTNELILFGIERKILQTVHKFCMRNNLMLKYVDNSFIASIILLPHLTGTGKKNFISVFINGNYYAIAFIKNSIPVFHRVVEAKDGKYTAGIFDKIEKFKSKIFAGNDLPEYYVFGDGLQQDLIDELNRRNGVFFKTVNPFKLLEVNQRLKENPFVQQQFYTFTAATGMAMRLI